MNIEELKFEKYKFKISLLKWFIASVVIVVVTIIIDKGFKERTAGIQEMQAFDKYVEIILKADNIQERWKLSEFFSTVTPTDRLRNRWITYRKLISPDYDTFKKLKQAEFDLKQEIKGDKSQEKINKLDKIKKQLEPFERKLAEPISQTTYKPNNVDFSSAKNNEPETELKAFKDRIRREASTDTRYTLDEYFKKANDINNTVVNDILKEIGEPYQNIQTGINSDFKDATFSNQYGIISKFDNTNKIWPLFQAKFTENTAVFTLNEDGKTETFTSPKNNINWENVKQFIRTYFLNRLNQLK